MDDIKRVIALGFFDGIHLGHAELLKKTVSMADAMGIRPSVLTFDRAPERIIAGHSPGLIFSHHDRSILLKELFGIEDSVDIAFDEALMHMPWRNFLEMLVSRYNAAAFVAGYDFHFGYMGRGSAENLSDWCRERNIGCQVVDEVKLGSVTVSSTVIRALLADGDVERVNRFLGHRYFLTGPVVHGQHLGRTIDMPTINMCYDDGVLVPRRGVYITRSTLMDTGERYPSVTNIGVRPTVSGTDAVSVETHLLGASGDMYGKILKVEFLSFLRPEMKFGSVDELKCRMHRDAADAAEYFANKHE